MTLVIACETIKEEVLYAADQVKYQSPISWMSSSLHKFPNRLPHQLQEQINSWAGEHAENILLLFGYCGNAVLGLSSPNARLIIPKMDDCVSVLLGGNERRNDLSKEGCAYYLTKGWLHSDSGIATEYNRCLMKYGYEKSNLVFQVMLKGYKSLDVINTGVGKLSDLVGVAQEFADRLELGCKVVDGTLDVLYKALRGQWDEDDFVILEPGEKVKFEHFGYHIPQPKMRDVISI